MQLSSHRDPHANEMEETHLSQTSPAPTPVLNADTSPPKTRKRPRAAEACDRCRSKKYKCDESYPCAHCKSEQQLRTFDTLTISDVNVLQSRRWSASTKAAIVTEAR